MLTQRLFRQMLVLAVLATFFHAMPVRSDEKPVINTAIVPAPACEKDFYNWDERHADVKKAIAEGPVDLVFIGDSITHLWGGRPKPNRQSGQKVWDEFYAPRNAVNLGFGWDRTQQVLWRLDNGEFEGISPKVAVVLIGTNNLVGHAVRENTNEEIVAGITAVRDLIVKKSPKTKVLLLGLLPRGKEPGNPLRARITSINEELAKLDGKNSTTFLELGAAFLQENGEFKPELAPDHLHLSEQGYRAWAEAMEPTLARLLFEGGSKPVN
jgi:lysophospholipase L1-like esterase